MTLPKDVLSRNRDLPVTMDEQIELSKDDRFLHLGVWDAVSSRFGTIDLPLEVSKPGIDESGMTFSLTCVGIADFIFGHRWPRFGNLREVRAEVSAAQGKQGAPPRRDAWIALFFDRDRV
jgi:hypothetical protein